jgi:formiminotetrahydrofolate cyclodeaminase
LAQHLVEDDPAPGGGFLNAMTIIGLSVAVIALSLAAGIAAWRTDA